MYNNWRAKSIYTGTKLAFSITFDEKYSGGESDLNVNKEYYFLHCAKQGDASVIFVIIRRASKDSNTAVRLIRWRDLSSKKKMSTNHKSYEDQA